MANTRYENFVIENQLKDQLATRMNLLNWATVNDRLQAEAGMKVKVKVYSATGAAETVAEGQGNTQSIEMSHADADYTVGTTQARFVYTDEDEMADPYLVEGGIRNLSDAITNAVNNDIIAEFGKAGRAVGYTGAPSFSGLVDAIALVDVKDDAAGGQDQERSLFGLCNRNTKAALQKALKDDLKYVEAFVRTGYIGTVAGVNLYICDAVPDDTLYIATREAVTYFRKKNVETENERVPNTRTNNLYGRVVGFAALTDDTKAVIYELGSHFTAVQNPSGNPKTLGYYVKSGDVYTPTADTSVVSGTTYYTKV